MSPKGIILIAGAIGVLFLGLLLFPTINENVQLWITNVMPGLSMTPLAQVMIKGLPYAGLGLFLLFAFWMVRNKEG